MRAPFTPDDLHDLRTVVFGITVTSIERYAADAARRRFVDVVATDLTDDWAPFAAERLRGVACEPRGICAPCTAKAPMPRKSFSTRSFAGFTKAAASAAFGWWHAARKARASAQRLTKSSVQLRPPPLSRVPVPCVSSKCALMR